MSEHGVIVFRSDSKVLHSPAVILEDMGDPATVWAILDDMDYRRVGVARNTIGDPRADVAEFVRTAGRLLDRRDGDKEHLITIENTEGELDDLETIDSLSYSGSHGIYFITRSEVGLAVKRWKAELQTPEWVVNERKAARSGAYYRAVTATLA